MWIQKRSTVWTGKRSVGLDGRVYEGLMGAEAGKGPGGLCAPLFLDCEMQMGNGHIFQLLSSFLWEWEYKKNDAILTRVLCIVNWTFLEEPFLYSLRMSTYFCPQLLLEACACNRRATDAQAPASSPRNKATEAGALCLFVFMLGSGCCFSWKSWHEVQWNKSILCDIKYFYLLCNHIYKISIPDESWNMLRGRLHLL